MRPLVYPALSLVFGVLASLSIPNDLLNLDTPATAFASFFALIFTVKLSESYKRTAINLFFYTIGCTLFTFGFEYVDVFTRTYKYLYPGHEVRLIEQIAAFFVPATAYYYYIIPFGLLIKLLMDKKSTMVSGIVLRGSSILSEIAYYLPFYVAAFIVPVAELVAPRPRALPILMGMNRWSFFELMNENVGFMAAFGFTYILLFLIYYRVKKNWASISLILASMTLLGQLLLSKDSGTPDTHIPVSLVRTNTRNPKATRNEEVLNSISGYNPSGRLIVLPENSFVFLDKKGILENKTLSRIMAKNDIAFGVMSDFGYGDGEQSYFALKTPEDEMQVYRKYRPAAFVEYNPLFKFIVEALPGRVYRTFNYRGLTVAPTLCSEVGHFDLIRKMFSTDFNLIIHGSNTGWMRPTEIEVQSLYLKMYSRSAGVPAILSSQIYKDVIYDSGNKIFESPGGEKPIISEFDLHFKKREAKNPFKQYSLVLAVILFMTLLHFIFPKNKGPWKSAS